MAKRADAAAIQEAKRAVKAGRVDEALRTCRQIVRRDRRNAEAHRLLASIALSRGDADGAIEAFERCAALRPRDPEPHAELGWALATATRLDEALARFERARRLDPDHAAAVAGTADVLERLGRDETARALLAGPIDAGTETAAMAVVEGRLALRAGELERVVEICSRHADDAAAGPMTRRHLHALVGKAHERAGRVEEAFGAYARSNAVDPPRFDLETHRREAELVMQTCTREALATMPGSGATSDLPVLVVGMPRCGSTLVERILDAHPAAHGAGEPPHVERLVHSLMYDLGSYQPYPECLRDLRADAAAGLAERYLDALAAGAPPDTRRVVDKALLTYRHLGLMQLLVPNARVIHCRRDPMDTCLSCWVEPLVPALHPYASDLADLGAVHRLHERLMAHWRDALDLPILEVVYEELVADPEAASRAIVEFCGLPWDDACLRFHETGRTAHTASYDQVRRPVYRTSVRRHVQFGALLDPLREALGMPATDAEPPDPPA